MMKKTDQVILALALDRDEKLDLRLSAELKAELKQEYRRFGFSTLSDYVLTILVCRAPIAKEEKK